MQIDDKLINGCYAFLLSVRFGVNFNMFGEKVETIHPF